MNITRLSGKFISKRSMRKKMGKNVILVDFNASEDWEFRNVIEKTTGIKWIVYSAASNENHGGILQKLIRYGKYFLTPIKIVINRNDYNKVLAWQQFYGLILAFYFRLMHIKESPEIVVLTFIYKPKKSLIGKIYDKFMRYIVTSGYVKYFVVFSESEKKRYADYFDIPESRFVFETLGYEDKTKDVPRVESGEFYLAAGRSNRDYKFLTEAWSKRKEKLEIICDTLNLKNATDNIEILTNCHDDDFFRELAKCRAVIVPLEDTHISSGQLVIIQAMMYGKPVIVTENDTVTDYIDSGRTGLVIKKTEKDLSDAIAALADEKYYEEISAAERCRYESKFSVYAMGTAIGKLLN